MKQADHDTQLENVIVSHDDTAGCCEPANHYLLRLILWTVVWQTAARLRRISQTFAPFRRPVSPLAASRRRHTQPH